MVFALDLVIQGLSFMAVVTIAIMAALHFEQVMSRRRRLGTYDHASAPSGAPLLQSQRENKLFKWIEESTSISDSEERRQLRRQLSLAGFDHQTAPAIFVIVRFGLAIGLPLLYVMMQVWAHKPATGLTLVMYALLLSGVGLFGPARFISYRADARRTGFEMEFPDALDLMVICVEAGLSMDAAFVRVGQEVVESHPRVSEEFKRLSEELRAGRSRSDALRAMADRIDVSGFRSFVALIIQTEALGASIGTALRTYSVEMRQTRLLKAEEKAMRIPVLMTIPIVLCMLPVIVSALLLPAIIDVMRHLLPTLHGVHR
jgi:tight adherence protein C